MSFGSPNSESIAREMKTAFDTTPIDQIEDAILKYVEIIRDWAYINFTLFSMALVTIKHSSKTRYPGENWNSLEEYNENRVEIRRLPELLSEMDICLRKMRIVFGGSK